MPWGLSQGGAGVGGGTQTPQTTPDLSSEKWSSRQQRPRCVTGSQTKRVLPSNRNCDTSKLQNSSRLKNGSAGPRPRTLPYRRASNQRQAAGPDAGKRPARLRPGGRRRLELRASSFSPRLPASVVTSLHQGTGTGPDPSASANSSPARPLVFTPCRPLPSLQETRTTGRAQDGSPRGHPGKAAAHLGNKNGRSPAPSPQQRGRVTSSPSPGPGTKGRQLC